MSKIIYTAQAHVDGGPCTATDEQLFAIGYAACSESALSVVARRKKLEVGDVAIDPEADLRTTDRGFELAVRLNVTLPGARVA